MIEKHEKSKNNKEDQRFCICEGKKSRYQPISLKRCSLKPESLSAICILSGSQKKRKKLFFVLTFEKVGRTENFSDRWVLNVNALLHTLHGCTPAVRSGDIFKNHHFFLGTFSQKKRTVPKKKRTPLYVQERFALSLLPH